MKIHYQKSQSAQTARITRLVLRPFQEFVQAETAGGLLLVICLLIAFLWANSPWSASYAHLLEIHLTIGVGSLLLDHPLHTWINDGLMAIFFLLVGTELKREVLVGELSSPRQATLPLLAAGGGALFPAMIYLIWNGGTGGARGWAIPMATDIAFALAILTLVGRSLPPALKVFRSALAIADDLIAVLIIALFYTQGLNWMALGVAGVAVAGLFLLRGMRQHRLLLYVLLGFLLWVALFHSGVHATIAGVVLAFLLPARSRLDLSTFVVQHKRCSLEEQKPSLGPNHDGCWTNSTRARSMHWRRHVRRFRLPSGVWSTCCREVLPSSLSLSLPLPTLEFAWKEPWISL